MKNTNLEFGLYFVMETNLQDQKNILLGKVQGFLEAFALFNTKTDHGYTFEFYCLNKTQTVEKTLFEYLSSISGINENSLKLTSISEPYKEIQEALNRWLFSFSPENDLHSYLLDARKAFSLSEGIWRSGCTKELTKLIMEISFPSSVFKIDFEPIKWYECSWEDFAFENQEQIFFLHLGVSD